jgi:hypothetical protein
VGNLEGFGLPGLSERQKKDGSGNGASLINFINLFWPPFLPRLFQDSESGGNLELLLRTRAPLTWNQSMWHKCLFKGLGALGSSVIEWDRVGSSVIELNHSFILITNLRCVTPQKSERLIYTAAEV